MVQICKTEAEAKNQMSEQDRNNRNRKQIPNPASWTGLSTRELPHVVTQAAGEDGHGDDDGMTGAVVVAEPKTQTKTPSFYRVLLLNDDYTPMDFVIHILQKFFSKDLEQATQIMLQVHHKGAGTCGVFPFDIAETKVYHVNQYSRQNRHPLKCTLEKA